MELIDWKFESFVPSRAHYRPHYNTADVLVHWKRRDEGTIESLGQGLSGPRSEKSAKHRVDKSPLMLSSKQKPSLPAGNPGGLEHTSGEPPKGGTQQTFLQLAMNEMAVILDHCIGLEGPQR